MQTKIEKTQAVKFESDVPIKENYLKLIPFEGLQARVPVAIIFSYFGFRDQVFDLMQVLSHTTRAYFVNSGGLGGFLIPYNVIDILNEEEMFQ